MRLARWRRRTRLAAAELSPLKRELQITRAPIDFTVLPEKEASDGGTGNEWLDEQEYAMRLREVAASQGQVRIVHIQLIARMAAVETHRR